MIKVFDLSDVESLWELADQIRTLSDEEGNDRTYTIELDQDEFDFLKDVVENEVVDSDTVETTAMFVHLRDKMLEAEGEGE